MTPMTHVCSMKCAGCGFAIESSGAAPIGFRESCDRCDADLHTCRNCEHHDPSAYNECVEPGAERVSERDRANRCDWFSAGGASGAQGDSVREKSVNDLEALFKK